MQKIANENMKIRIAGAEVETQPGAGKTQVVSLAGFDDKKDGSASKNPNQPAGSLQKDTLHNLFLSHLLRPREWTA